MSDLLDEMCDADSTMTAACDDCDWTDSGQGLAEIRTVMHLGDLHATGKAHSVKLDLNP